MVGFIGILDVLNLFFVYIKKNYYHLSRERLLKEAKDRYYSDSKEKVAKYYKDNQDVLRI